MQHDLDSPENESADVFAASADFHIALGNQLEAKTVQNTDQPMPGKIPIMFVFPEMLGTQYMLGVAEYRQR
jgi:hypothetical protein